MSLSTMMRRAAAGVSVGGGAFDVETDITWHSLFWAEGTDFVAQGYSDTDSVSPWPNETGESNAAAIYAGTLDEVNAAYNDQPTVYFASNRRYSTGAFSVNPSYTSGVSIVMVGNLTSSGYAFGGLTSGGRHALYRGATTWNIGAGSFPGGGTPDSDPHLFVVHFDGSTGNDTLTIDGSTVIDTDAGSQTLTGFRFRGRYDGAGISAGDTALLGIYEGDITANGAWADFESWTEDHYGLTIA